MNVVFIIPTGIGCTIGGHAGDATPAAKLIAQTCDKLILNPNVVNASDINEMPSNSLYVEGSILDRFLEGYVNLQEVSSNKVLVAVNSPVKPETINAINAAKSTIGMDLEIVELNTPLTMTGRVFQGLATGEAKGVSELISQVEKLKFDALAIASPIDVESDVALNYFKKYDNSINPWGWIESHVSRLVATALNKPVAHAPIESESTKNNVELFNILYDKIVDRRKAAEICSNCYIHCILKGLHKAPRPVFNEIRTSISRSEVACLVTPYGCINRPHYACLSEMIPIIAVKENKTAYNDYDERILYADNYLEAAGMVSCIIAGIEINSVRSNDY